MREVGKIEKLKGMDADMAFVKAHEEYGDGRQSDDLC